MSLFSHISFKSILSKLSFVLIFVLLAFGFTACDSNKNISVSLSNDGATVVLYLENGVSTTETIYAYVKGDKGISKEISVSSNNAYITVETASEDGNATAITLTASGVCQNAVITVTTLEGNKTVSFYVNVEVPVSAMYSTTDSKNLYVVRGEPKALNSYKLIQYSPVNTTQQVVEFSLLDELASGVNLSNGVLTITDDYAFNQITLKATSVDKPNISTFITLDVLEPISSVVEYSANYSQTAGEIDLAKTISLTKNIADTKSVDFVIELSTSESVSIIPYVKSTLKTESEIVEFVSSTKSQNNDKTRFVFTLTSTQLSGNDEVYFVMSYDVYGYTYTSQSFKIETHDAIKSIQLLTDGLVPASNTAVVYHEYYGSKIGLQIDTEVTPSAIPEDQRVLILELQTGSSEYTFYKKNAFGFAEEIIFTDDQYEFVGGEAIFVKANSMSASNGAIKIFAKVNPAISKTLFLDATQGTLNLEINGTQIDQDGNKVVYLTSNEVMTQSVSFFIDNDEGNSVEIMTSGDAFTADSKSITRIQANNYTFQISSVKGKVSADGILVIRSANGFSASLRVEVFEELTLKDIKLSVPTPQGSTAVGNMQVISNFSNTVNLQFSVAIKQGTSITLTKNISGATSISYGYSDTLLSDYENAYASEYQNFMHLAIFNNMQNLTFGSESDIVQASYLSGMSEIYGLDCGKTCIEATIFGYELNGESKQPVSFKTYFFVEVYIPVDGFALSKTSLTLYSAETLGVNDMDYSEGRAFVYINEDATYSNIEWTSNYGFDFTLGGKNVYNFVFEDGEVAIKAHSTTEAYEEGGETKYHSVASRTFFFVAKVQEFGKTYTLTLKVEIKKAQQVEKIAVLDVNLQQGIYLQLDNSGKDLTRPITAEVQIGKSNIEPFNSELVFEFLPDAYTESDAITVNRGTGYITVDGSRINGGAGIIRIAPADRYTPTGYVAGENDVAVYIPITIADGNSRATAYRVNNLSQITELDKHYVLMQDVTAINPGDFVFNGALSGGLYGALIGSNEIATIQTSKTLFSEITLSGKVADLIITSTDGEIAGNCVLANKNKGSIENVTVESFNSAGNYTILKASEDVGYVGGLVAENYGKITDSAFFGGIESTSNAVVGGLVGLNTGDIFGSKVEVYNYNSSNTTTYAKISGTSFVGGLVGEMTAGTLKNSYFQSYASENTDPKNYIGLEVISGQNVGVLVGNLTGGNIDKTFGYANDLTAFTGNATNLSYIKNAYLVFRTDNQNASGTYIQNHEYTEIRNLNYAEVWALDSEQNFGLPYFKGIVLEIPLESILNTLANADNIFSIQGKSVIFHYSTSGSLTLQEIYALSDLNFITFEELLGTTESLVGLRGISSDSKVIAVFANGVQITGKGSATLTLFSKYDSTISQTFEIYTINPILDFKLMQNGVEFGDNSNLKIKTNNNFSLTALLQNSIILDQNYVLIDENEYQLSFQEDLDSYISGKNLNATINTIKLYEDFGLDLFEVEYALSVVSDSLSSAEKTAINEILGNNFSGSFFLNFYKGADVVDVNQSEFTMQPSGEIIVEGFILSDIAPANESLEIIVDSQEFEDIFDIQTQYISSEYFTSKIDLTQKTQNIDEAVYFKHYYRISLEVKSEYKNYDFDQNTTSNGDVGTELKLLAYAKSSLGNAETIGTDLVFEDFSVVINSQEITSINASHYTLIDKNLVYDSTSKKNIVYHSYSGTSTSVLSPGEEGLLKINLFPDYADYDYITVTYSAQNGANGNLTFGLMKKETNGLFTRNNNNYAIFEDGIIVYNAYSLDESNIDNQNIIYISTFVPLTTNQDVVFNIQISAIKNQVAVKTIPFNLIVQYLEGADIAVYNPDGREVDNVARGTTQKLVVTLEKDQTLENLFFTGVDTSISSVGNYITYANQTIEELPSSILKTITYDLYVGETLEILHNANYVTVEAVISWKENGKQQTKTTTMALGIVDFVIDEITLLTDKLDKTNLTTYVGLDTNLQFDFNGNQNQGGNDAFNQFIQNFYYEKKSDLGTFGDYVVNTNNYKAKSFLGNLYYVNGDGSTSSIVSNDGTINSNSYFTINVDETTGKISITGIATTTNPVKLVFKLQVQYPNAESRYYTTEINFNFTITVVKYSDEDTPLIIENEAGFYDAIQGNTPENYILMTDLYLEDYTPQTTNAIKSLDGNNFTINIMSYDDSSVTQVENFALFETVNADTILKNLTVNIYHAGLVSVNTSVTRSVNIAGLAITNYGIIYNCEVVAFNADKTIPELGTSGIVASYSSGNISSLTTSTIAGFVVYNEGNISNSRVGGNMLHKVNSNDIPLSVFSIAGQGNIAGFVYENRGNIASSYFANGQITNNTASGIETRTAGFVGQNSGQIHTSYVKGVGNAEYSLSGGGISTSSISAGFVYTNSGDIGDSYSNIMLASGTGNTTSPYESGRFTAGFAYINSGEIERCYTASKIENAKNTQTAFLGVDENNQKQNTGTIKNSYYYASSVLEGDSYTDLDQNVSIKRIQEPDNTEYFYGFAFSDDTNSVNGVWYATAYGVDLVSANQIAVSNRYLANVTRNAVTNEIESYNLPYTEGYEYGSKINPIIIKNADEYNMAFGGFTTLQSTAVEKYRSQTEVYGNYRLISDINFSDIPSTQSGKIGSTDKTLKGGIVDGNMFTISGLDLTASADTSVLNYGLFAKLEQNAIIMNMNVNVILVSAGKAQNVGAIAGSVYDSKLINISLMAGSQTQNSNVTGRNIVGALAGIVQGDSEVKNITATNISVTAEYKVPSSSQGFSRNNSEIINLNAYVSYAGGIIGVADIYGLGYSNTYTYDQAMKTPHLLFLKTEGSMVISGSTAGGVIGYMGPRTFMKDATLELSNTLTQKIIADKFYAGGIVGENYGDLDMLRAQHELALQNQIESDIPLYYQNPASTEVERGNLTLFESTSQNKPLAIGGLVGLMTTGKITHAYSKVNVISKYATYAGGVVGQIPGLLNASKYQISLNEVYAFGDVKASDAEKAGAGGIAGYIDFGRKLAFNKVNAVNFWGLVEDNGSFTIPQNTYSVFALTGSSLLQSYVAPEYIDNIAKVDGEVVSLNPSYSGYNLPSITCAVGSDDMFAVTTVKFNGKTKGEEVSLKKSFAKLNTGSYYDMIQSKQSITPLYELSTSSYNGVTMDQYFLQSDWDPNYWVRYTTELLPKLVMFSDTNLFYIDKAEDLQKIIQFPSATFIVRAAESPVKPIINIGSYLVTSGIDFSSIVFTGVLKGLDNTMNYGFDFEGLAVPFFESIQNAKIYNLTFKNLGSSNTQAIPTSSSITNTATQSSFENLTISNCHITASLSEGFNSVGILANKISGGYISNITFVNCSVTALASEDLSETDVSVGMLAGKIETVSSANMQIGDVTAYMSSGFVNSPNSTLNDIVINANNHPIKNLSVGSVAGSADGAVMLAYTTTSATSERVKGVGVANTTNPKQTYTPDSSYNGINNGLVINVQNRGNIERYNAGLLFGEANNLTVSFQRVSTDSRLNIVGAITASENANIGEANIGGIVGKSNTSTSLTNGATVKTDAFVVVDVDMALTAEKVNAGMLIGSAIGIEGIDNIETFGTINVKATSGQTNIGGFVGVVNGDLKITNAISRTSLTYTNSNTNLSGFANVGGMIGLFNTTSSSLILGNMDYDAKYIGRITIDGSNVNVGGLVGGIVGSRTSVSNVNAVEIIGTVFGGSVLVKSGEAMYVGGIVGNSNTSGSYELRKTLTKNLSYGDIHVSANMTENDKPSYFGGILGKGSSATHLNTNYSVCTITSASSDITENMNINAVVGSSNGTLTDSDAKNYYSNQLTLCLDYNETDLVNGLQTENVYFYTNNGLDETLPTLASVIVDYKTQLDDYEENVEVYEGSKLDPIQLTNSNFNQNKKWFESDNNGRKTFFVLTESLSQDVMKNISLKNAHFVGDGFETRIASDALFASVDANSVVAGVKVVANSLSTHTTTVYSKSGTVATGSGTLANINLGTIYSCNATESEGPEKFKVIGIQNSLSDVYTGGLVGVNGGQILDSATDVDVKTSAIAGAFVGLNDGIINNSYTTGSVNALDSYAFGQGSANGKIYSSYTSAITQNNGSVGSGVFGDNATTDCHYDLYTTGTYDDNGIESDTNTMSTMIEVSEENPKDIFLSNSKASKKFAYDITTNYGFLSFSGEAYKNFPHLKNSNTGDGSVDNAFMIHSVGKLQQLNTMVESKNYKLINDLSISSDMTSNGDEDYGVIEWKPIGLAETTAFIGNISGAYDGGKQHTLTNITAKTFEGSTYSGIFGATQNANISDITVKGSAVSTTANNIGGLVAVATDSNISNIEIELSGLTYSASSGASIGGVAGVVKGTTTTIENCNVASGFEMKYSTASATSSSAIGGIAGKIEGKATIDSCASIGNLAITYSASGSVSAGALVGLAVSNFENAVIKNSSIGGNVEIKTTSSGSVGADFGAIAGKIENFALQNIDFDGKSTISYGSKGNANLGGLVGSATNSKISNVGASNIAVIYNTDSTGSGSANLGGLFGNLNSTTVANITTPTTFAMNYTSKSSSAETTLGGLVGKAESSTIGNTSTISLKDGIDIEYNSSGTAYIGGLVGKASGSGTSANFNKINLGDNYDLTYTTSQTGGTAYIGAIAGGNGSDIADVNAGDNYTIKSSAKDSYLGSLVGVASDGELYSCDAGASYNISASGSGDAYLGGLAGSVDGGDVIYSNADDSYTLTYTGTGTGYLGGIAGDMTSGSIEDSTTGGSYELEFKGSKTAYMGGVVGKMSGGSVENSSTGDSYTFTNSDDKNSANKNTNYMGGIAGLYSGGSFFGSNAFTGAGFSFKYEEAGASYMGGLFGSASVETQGQNIDPYGVKLGGSPTFTYSTSETQNIGNSYMGGIVAKADGLTMNASTQYTVPVPTFNYTGEGNAYYGGVAGEISNSTISKITISGFTLSELDGKVKSIGAVASIISNTNLKDINVESVNLSLKGSGYAGGVAGEVNGANTCTFENVKIIGSTIKDNAQDKNTAIGGLIGKANASGLTIKNCSTTSTSIIGFYTAGGLVGYGNFAEITGSNNGATVSVHHNTAYFDYGTFASVENANVRDTDGKSRIYAGGIVGNMTGGKISGSTVNSGSVSSASSSTIEGRDYADTNNYFHSYAGGIVGYTTSATIESVSNTGPVYSGFGSEFVNKLDQDGIRAIFNGNNGHASNTYSSAGSEGSYAGGIVGYASGTTITNATVGSVEITAKAFNQLTISGYKGSQYLFILPNTFELILNKAWYEYETYYLVQEQKANGFGVGYMDNGSTCTNATSTASVTGGEKIEFNIYWSNGGNAPWITSKPLFYILDYGVKANGDYYSSWVAYDEWTSVFGYAKAAWNNSGLTKVCFDKNSSTSERYIQATFSYTTSGFGQYIAKSENDFGRLVYETPTGERLYYNDYGQLCTYTPGAYNDMTGFVEDPTYEVYYGETIPVYEYDDNGVLKQNPNYTPPGSVPPNNKIYFGATTNLDANINDLVTSGLKGSKLLKTLSGSLIVLQATSGADSTDKFWYLNGSAY